MSTPQPPWESPSISAWLPPEEEIEDGPAALMMSFGYARNIKRHAEAWGPTPKRGDPTSSPSCSSAAFWRQKATPWRLSRS